MRLGQPRAHVLYYASQTTAEILGLLQDMTAQLVRYSFVLYRAM